MNPEIATQDYQDIDPKDTKAVRDLLELIKKEKIELPQGMIDRLKLLDTPKCSEGECIFSEEESYDVIVKGEKITKKNETHLEHSLELVEIIRFLLPSFLRQNDGELKDKYTNIREKMITAALLHDIGKTGPETDKEGGKIDPSVNEDFVLLFSIFEKRRTEEGGKNLSECSIREAIERHIPKKDQERVMNSIQKVPIPGNEQTFDLDKNKMKDIFGSHVEFSLEILQKYEKRGELKSDPLVTLLVSKHHRFGNSYNYEPHEELYGSLPDNIRAFDDRLTTLIELADMYQAMSSRGTQKNALETFNKIQSKFISIESKNPGTIPQYVFDIIKKIMSDQVIIEGLDEIKG